MASLKDVKIKIAGVGKTRQITKAMYMVASAKLLGSQSRIERFRPYAEKFAETLGHICGQTAEGGHPLLQVHRQIKNTTIILFTSDRGLCGSLNVSLISPALGEAKKRASEGKSISFVCFGKKGQSAVEKSSFPVSLAYSEEDGTGFNLAGLIGREIISRYVSEVTDEVILIYPEFRSAATQVPRILPLLPISPALPDSEPGANPRQGRSATDFLYEPHVGELLNQLLPMSISAQIYRAVLDTAASENAARMVAMDNATRNCDELISSLTLLYNKTRQATITSELIDIVSGANAL